MYGKKKNMQIRGHEKSYTLLRFTAGNKLHIATKYNGALQEKFAHGHLCLVFRIPSEFWITIWCEMSSVLTVNWNRVKRAGSMATIVANIVKYHSYTRRSALSFYHTFFRLFLLVADLLFRYNKNILRNIFSAVCHIVLKNIALLSQNAIPRCFS